MILHIVNKSPFHHPALERCLSLLSANDGVLLIEDGVLLAANGTVAKINRLDPQRLFWLTADLRARGFDPQSIPMGKAIDYADFVGLVCQYEKSVSWF